MCTFHVAGMAGISNELGAGSAGKPFTNTAVWDPLGFGSLSDTVEGEHSGVMPHAKWMREAELKHGRAAMLAFVGTCVAANGVHFPGEMGGYYYEAGRWEDGLASALSTNPFGMAQLLLSIALIEVNRFAYSEVRHRLDPSTVSSWCLFREHRTAASSGQVGAHARLVTWAFTLLARERAATWIR